ncbi:MULTISPECIES: restriction endonuclease subunit S [unclassified Thalassospira]|uniref:restriction endonuclease subunit S n=1 Tax=unclassified Thalassospira TaxID=2648997 RepID=UPI000C3CB1D7|nr:MULTISPECIES: restriction endonuclease subunit S [unclassified Thalassospira]MBC45059.1 hypothetical protein [Thalassospira sp.]HAI29618.1 restriction endonuclease subunit S [Thalassospira sp.]|tara:strand:- start:14265 stop:15536 length:1272 start_codon:yes stop_codon:yes gene_type:complete
MTHEIPEGWAETTVGSISEIITKGTTPTTSGFGYRTEGIPFIKAENIDDHGNIGEPTAFVSDECHSAFRRSIIKKDTILFTIAGTLGRVAVYKDQSEANTNQAVALIKGINQDLSYVAYYLQCPRIKKLVEEQKTTGAQPNISLTQLKNFPISLPPQHEQKKIAEVLSSVDETIAATKAVIDQTNQVKKGLVQNLLTKGIGHTRFKQTELGEIPESWEVVELGDLVEALKAGVSVNSENRTIRDNEAGILKTSCVTNGFFDAAEHKAILSHELARAKNPVKADSIIISRMNTPALVGANAYVSQDYPNLFLPDRLWQLSVKDTDKTLVRWLSFVFASYNMRARMSGIATGTSGSMKNISKAKLLSLLVAVPKKYEQIEISEILSSFEQELGILQRYIAELQSLKTGVMSELLSGKKRVEVGDV